MDVKTAIWALTDTLHVWLRPKGGDRTKWYWTKWHGQNGMDKMVATFIDSNSTELNFYSVSQVTNKW